MPALPFLQLDVFASTPRSGNPLAVVFDAAALDGGQMQSIAAWLGLSETTFVLPPTDPSADYALRIFTPGGELPFAGHPTLGTAAAWLQRGGRPRHAGRVIQQCGAGLVPVRITPAEADGNTWQLAFRAPPMRQSPLDEATLERVTAALALPAGSVLDCRWLNNGPDWCALWLDSAERVLALQPDLAALRARRLKVGVAAAHPPGRSDADIEVRAFVPHLGVGEDPVTGSLNASLAQWLIAAGVLPARYVAAQGTALGRAGRVQIERDGQGQVWVGGAVRVEIEGWLRG